MVFNFTVANLNFYNKNWLLTVYTKWLLNKFKSSRKLSINVSVRAQSHAELPAVC